MLPDVPRRNCSQEALSTLSVQSETAFSDPSSVALKTVCSPSLHSEAAAAVDDIITVMVSQAMRRFIAFDPFRNYMTFQEP